MPSPRSRRSEDPYTTKVFTADRLACAPGCHYLPPFLTPFFFSQPDLSAAHVIGNSCSRCSEALFLTPRFQRPFFSISSKFSLFRPHDTCLCKSVAKEIAGNPTSGNSPVFPYFLHPSQRYAAHMCMTLGTCGFHILPWGSPPFSPLFNINRVKARLHFADIHTQVFAPQLLLLAS